MRLPMLRHAVAAAALVLTAGHAQATLITFDELPWHPIESFSDYPVDTQYAPLGVTFLTGYLQQTYYPTNPPAHLNQYLLGGHELAVTFSGDLPNYVSFNMSSPYSAASESYVVALDSSGHEVGRGRTGGTYPDGSQDPPFGQDLPYQANRLISLSSTTGIASLQFWDAYGSRLSTSIDNLYFADVPAVPEPASLALWGAGLAVVAVARKRRRSKAGQAEAQDLTQ
jgi:hypothetical protein